MPTAKKYVVANPRGIPAGIHVLNIAGKRYFEGDECDAPLSAIQVRNLTADGFLKEAS